MKSRLFVLAFILIQAQLVWLITLSFSNQGNQKVVNLERLFENFDYKNELEKKIKAMDTHQTNVLDSLEIQLNALSKNLSESNDDKEKKEIQAQFDYTSKIYRLKNEQFKNNLSSAIEQFDEKIWNQLRAYSVEYGKKNGFEIVFGFDDQNTVLYHTDEKDITEDLIQFINNRYQGKEN